VLAQVNALLCADLPPSMFVTCFYAILEPATGRLRFANAGQDLPYLRRADGSVGELHARGMPLGLMPDMVYDESATALALGDAVLFYSDGLVEAHNPAREMFGFPRLRALLGGDAAIAAPIPLLLRELADFTRPDWEQEDDITLVALRRPE
jgi:serine phosphatase RsbU (regulator of sigma subunit)